MKILLSNDDGVDASGILAAKQLAEEFGETYVVAPSNQQSGIGHALTLYAPLRINRQKLRDGSIAYSVSGTPTDAVTLGIYEIIGEKPDLVISGINTGKNVGKGELTTSGTLGAAMEAVSLGIPAIAVSQDITKDEIKFDEGFLEIDFSPTQKVLRELLKKILEKGWPEGINFLNLNVPSDPDSYEIAVVGLGDRMYCPGVQELPDPRGKPYYWITGDEYDNNPKDSDAYVLANEKRPTLTPLSLDMTASLDKLKNW